MDDGDELAIRDIEARKAFLDAVAAGTPRLLAGIEVGWLPAKTRQLLTNRSFLELVEIAEELADEGIEQALYAKAKSGNMTAMQLWLYNRKPERWKDVKRIEMKIDGEVSIEQVRTNAATVLELLRSGADIAALQPGGALDRMFDGDIQDAEIVERPDGD